MKEKCLNVRNVRNVRMLDWRKGALCLLSVVAMGVQAAHVTVDVPRHTTATWTSGSVTKDVTNDGFDVPNGTMNVVVTFKPDYPCFELDKPAAVVIPGPINEDVTLYNLPRASIKDVVQSDWDGVKTYKYKPVRWIKSDGNYYVPTGYEGFSIDKVKVECVVNVPKEQKERKGDDAKRYGTDAAIFGIQFGDDRDEVISGEYYSTNKTYAFYAKYGNEGTCAFNAGTPPNPRVESTLDFPYGQKTWLTCDSDTASWETENGATTGVIRLSGPVPTIPFPKRENLPPDRQPCYFHVFTRFVRTEYGAIVRHKDIAAATLWSLRVSEKEGEDYAVKCDLLPCVETCNGVERRGLYDLAEDPSRKQFHGTEKEGIQDTDKFEVSPLRDDEVTFSIRIPEHASAVWTSGDGTVTNEFPIYYYDRQFVYDSEEVVIREKTRNLTFVLTPEYGYELDYGDKPDGHGVIVIPGPITKDLTVDEELVPRPVWRGHTITGCRVEHATAVWTRGDGSVTNNVPGNGEFLVADGETDIRIIFTPAFGYELDKTEYVIPGPVSGDVEFPAEGLPTATLREDGDLPMTDIVQWGSWSARNGTRHAPHGSFIVTPGQPMFDAYTQRLAKDPGDVDATVRRAFVRLKMLSENEGFAKLLKMYGFEFFNGDMRFRGNLTDDPDVMETPEAIRTVCDECGPLSDAFPIAGIGALKVLDGVFADLDRVSSEWTGELEISPEDYPVDEKVLFDYADIQALKASVLEASSVLNILKGYNMKLDKSMLRETFGALNRGPYPAGETGRNGTRRVLALNPEFMDKVIDPHALALAQAQMQRAAIAAKEFYDWQDKRTNKDVHFLEIAGYLENLQNFIKSYKQKIIDLPYWTCENFDLTALSSCWSAKEPKARLRDTRVNVTLRGLFDGRLTRDVFPEFGSKPWLMHLQNRGRQVGWTEGNDLFVDRMPDPSIGGTFPALTRMKLGEFIDRFTTDGSGYYDTGDNAVTEIPVKYDKNFFIPYGYEFVLELANSVCNPASIAAGITDPFFLLYPHFNCLEFAYWDAGYYWPSDEGVIPVPPKANKDGWILLDCCPKFKDVWDQNAAFPTDRVGVCSWTFCADTETAVDLIVSDGRYKTVSLALAPWAWQGASEESWRRVKEKIRANGLRVASTMIEFPGEDYGSLHSASNTQGFLSGILEDSPWQHDRWASNLVYVADAAWRTRDLGIRRLTVKIGFIAVDEELMYKRVKAVCDECLRYDVDLLIEAGSQPSSVLMNFLRRLRYGADPFLKPVFCNNVALSFDPCECVLYGAEDPVSAFTALKDEIRQVHLRDCKLDRASWNEDCPWGEGDFSKRADFAVNDLTGLTFVEVLKAGGFQGDILYERRSGDATLTQERKREAREAMSRFLDEFGVLVPVLGSPANPWVVGSYVLAYTNGEGKLVLDGNGETELTPWADAAAGITELAMSGDMTGVSRVTSTLPDLERLTGTLLFSEAKEIGGGASEPPEGAIGAGVESVRIVDGKAILGVIVSTNSELKVEGEGWQKADIEKAEVVDGEAILTVPVPAEKGFMILKSKDAEGNGK